MSIRLYVGNLPEDLSRQELEAVFAEEGDSTIKSKLSPIAKQISVVGSGLSLLRVKSKPMKSLRNSMVISSKRTL